MFCSCILTSLPRPAIACSPWLLCREVPLAFTLLGLQIPNVDTISTEFSAAMRSLTKESLYNNGPRFTVTVSSAGPTTPNQRIQFGVVGVKGGSLCQNRAWQTSTSSSEVRNLNFYQCVLLHIVNNIMMEFQRAFG